MNGKEERESTRRMNAAQEADAQRHAKRDNDRSYELLKEALDVAPCEVDPALEAKVVDFMEGLVDEFPSIDNLAVIAADEFDLYTPGYGDVLPWVLKAAKDVYKSHWGRLLD